MLAVNGALAARVLSLFAQHSEPLDVLFGAQR
jgi:hypothetical protein